MHVMHLGYILSLLRNKAKSEVEDNIKAYKVCVLALSYDDIEIISNMEFRPGRYDDCCIGKPLLAASKLG